MCVRFQEIRIHFSIHIYNICNITICVNRKEIVKTQNVIITYNHSKFVKMYHHNSERYTSNQNLTDTGNGLDQYISLCKKMTITDRQTTIYSKFDDAKIFASFNHLFLSSYNIIHY